MKKKLLYLFIVIAILACILLIWLLKPAKSEKIVQDFLKEAFTKSESNSELYQKFQESSVVIGEGVKSEIEKQSQEKSKQAEQAFKDTYGRYLNDEGIEDFNNQLFDYFLGLYSKDEKWDVKEIKVTEDNNKYKFYVSLEMDDGETKVEGRMEIIDGKIGKISIT